MALTITEDTDSRSLTETRREGRLELSLERRYTIRGSDDSGDAAVRALGPQPGESYGDGSLNLYVISRRYDVLLATGSSGALRLTASYGPPEKLPENQNPDEPEYELSTMAETAHIEVALAQDSYPDTGAGKAIGLDNDGRVTGVDIYVPKGTYTETRDMRFLDKRYRARLFSLTGTVNAAKFKGWNKGEVLFMGASARRRGYGVWKLEYQFAIQPTVAQSIDTNGVLRQFDKEGWRYMWLQRKQAASADKTSVQQAVIAAHVAQVYPYGDFSLLGIGTQ